MSDATWTSVKMDEAGVGDKVRIYGAIELDVTRIDDPFLGREDMVLFVESTDERWACAPVPRGMDIEIQR
jgi:hypothetical protein